MFFFFLILKGLGEGGSGDSGNEDDDNSNEEEDDSQDEDDSQEDDSEKEELERREQEDQKLYFVDYIKKKSFESEDPKPHYKQAYVSCYSYDIQPYFGYLQMLIVLGYTLKTLSPQYDRVLIVWEKLAKEEQIMSILKKVWTHIIVRPYIKWPGNRTISNEDQALWFKLYTWTLTQYNKICYIGADTLIFRDISEVFNYNPPAAAYDMTEYGFTDSFLRFQHDFFLLKPSWDDFAQLMFLATNYVDHPHKESYHIGSHDAAVLHRYYGNDISILPLVMMHENGGNKKTILQDPYHPTSKILSKGAHFDGDTKPWKRRMTVYSEVWMLLASSCYEKLDVPFSAGSLGQQGEDLINLLFGNAAEFNKLRAIAESIQQEEEEEMMQDIYPDITHSGVRRNITMIFLVLFISLLMLKSTIGTSNPFNVFINKIEDRVDQFIRLDADYSQKGSQPQQHNRRVSSASNQQNNDSQDLNQSSKKKKKHRKHKRKDSQEGGITSLADPIPSMSQKLNSEQVSTSSNHQNTTENGEV